MSNETTKTKKIWTETEKSYLQGKGIDIGCGADPVFPHVIPFDQEHGDANRISEYINEKLDFVFSSHCLEHMLDPVIAFKEWYKLLKPGGYLFVLVPDEDLYEQGNFPSRFNSDHKWTFTLSKNKSWSPKSVNVFQLVKDLNCEIVNLKLQDHNFDYALYNHGGSWWSYHLWRWFKKLSRPVRGTLTEVCLSRFFRALGSSFDQTWMGGDRLAQIQIIVKKPN